LNLKHLYPRYIVAAALGSAPFFTAPAGAEADGAPSAPAASSEKILFQDPMTGDWEKNWFLDGKKSELETSEKGLHFTATTIPGIWEQRKESQEKRELFDSMHAVLWTKQEFEGEVWVSFEMTRTSESFTALLYLLAQGVGWGPYAPDISEWNELRDPPTMNLYYDGMNLTGLTFREEVRLRRYPWHDEKKNELTDNLIGDKIDYDKLPVGKTYRVDVELRQNTMRFRIEEVGNPDNVVDKTYDRVSDLDPRRPTPSTRGRIGLRHMTGTSIIYHNFEVRQL
jgi:hypothetical protein